MLWLIGFNHFNVSSSYSYSLNSFYPNSIADVIIDGDSLHCLTSNSNLQDIWQRLIRHCHPIDHVK